MATLHDLYVIAAPLDHPEGITTGPDGELYAGGEAGQVYRIDRDTSEPIEIANTGGFVLGLCLDAAGMIYLCNMDAKPAVLRVDPATGNIDTWCDSAGGGPLETPNFCSFAADGSLYFTDSGTEDMDIQNGRLIRVPPGGGDGEVLDLGPLHFPNGMCIDADGNPVFLETLTPRLSRVVDGKLELLADLAGNSPDGVTLCADGGLPGGGVLPVPAAVRPGGGRPGGHGAGRSQRDPHPHADQRDVLRRGAEEARDRLTGRDGGEGHRPRHRRRPAPLPRAAVSE